MSPWPPLPVDSARSCSSQAPRPWMPGEATSVALSRPFLASTPMTIPSAAPGFSSTETLAAQARAVETHHRGWHHPEVGERRVAPADRRQAEEDAPEAIGLGDPLHLRPRVGDRDEAAPDLRGTDGRLHALEEVLLEDVRLERRARLGRDDEERPREIHGRLERPDLRGIGRVEDVELGPADEAAEGHPEDFGAKARAAHAEHEDVAEASLPDVFGGAADVVDTAELLVHDPEPAEPPRLVAPGPQRRVPRPEPAHLPAIRPVLERGLGLRLEIAGKPVTRRRHRLLASTRRGSRSTASSTHARPG